MKYLKKFNESKEIYDEEMRFIENSMTYIADEYDLSYRDVDLDWSNVVEDTENYYHISEDKYRLKNLGGLQHGNVNDYIITTYIMLEGEKFDATSNFPQKISEYPAYLNEKYPNIITKLEKFKNDSIQFIQNNGTKVQTEFKIYKYYGLTREYLKVRLSFYLKKN